MDESGLLLERLKKGIEKGMGQMRKIKDASPLTIFV
jgi:hypothetical protein